MNPMGIREKRGRPVRRLGLSCQLWRWRAAEQLQAEQDTLGNGLDVATERGRSRHDPGLTCTGGARCHFTEAGKRDRRDWDVIFCMSASALSVYMY